MNRIKVVFLRLLLLLFLTIDLTAQNNVNLPIDTGIEPRYKRTNYSDQSILLENDQIQLRMYRRIGGWGWGEIATPSGQLMAVLDHLGEIMLRDQDIPMRFEAAEVTHRNDERGESLVFQVKSVVARNNLTGTSFEE